MVIASKTVVFPAPVAPVIAYKPTSLNCSFSKSITIGVADFNEFTNIKKVIIRSSKNKVIKILFDQDHSFEDRVIKEQFSY